MGREVFVYETEGLALNFRVISKTLKPHNIWVAAEPCPLALGVVPASLLCRSNSFVDAHAAVNDRKRLLVADGFEGLSAWQESTNEDRFHFIDESPGEHLLDTPVDAFI